MFGEETIDTFMNQDQRLVRDWMCSFGQETPDAPSVPSLEVRRLRANLILEEALETIFALGFRVKYDDLAMGLEAHGKPDLIAIADGCADLRVVTLGTEVACGISDEKTFNEVMRSNWTKLWKGNEIGMMSGDCTAEAVRSGSPEERTLLVKRNDGKVIKSPSFSEPVFIL